MYCNCNYIWHNCTVTIKELLMFPLMGIFMHSWKKTVYIWDFKMKRQVGCEQLRHKVDVVDFLLYVKWHSKKFKCQKGFGFSSIALLHPSHHSSACLWAHRLHLQPPLSAPTRLYAPQEQKINFQNLFCIPCIVDCRQRTISIDFAAYYSLSDHFDSTKVWWFRIWQFSK